MKECVQSYYIRDGEILDCGTFPTGLVDREKSIYEVLRLINGRILFLDDHLDRLFSSLGMEGIKPWMSREDIMKNIDVLITENHSPDGNIKIVMNVPDHKSSCFMAYFVNHRYPAAVDYKKGVKTITFPFERSDPNKKLWRPEFRKRVNEALAESGAFEALLLDSNGYLPEASKANVFAIRKDLIITAPGELILPGITRKFVLEICRELSLSVDYRKIALHELSSLDGVFLTGTSLHVLPVCLVDEYPLAVEHPIMRLIMKHFQKIIQS